MTKETEKLPEWQQRLLDEYKELNNKYTKLCNFCSLNNKEYTKLSELEQQLLRSQREKMIEYLDILGYRLDFYHIKH